VRRDFTPDFHAVREGHIAIHDRLVNWSLWARDGRGGSSTLAMFKFYRDGYHEIQAAPAVIDEIDATAIQKSFTTLPEKHRHALGWVYCKPWIPVHIVRRVLGLRTDALVELVNDSRTMMKNICATRLTVR